MLAGKCLQKLCMTAGVYCSVFELIVSLQSGYLLKLQSTMKLSDEAFPADGAAAR